MDYKKFMLKKNLRNIYKEKRNHLSFSQKAKLDDLMLIQFQKLPIDIPSMIMSYAPFEKHNEFNPQIITDYCYFKNPNQVLFYPVIDENKQTLESVVVNDDTVFKKNKYGIDEPVNGMDMFPEEIDLVFVPLLCIDKKGNRVGYGKGYYDRFLKECRKDIIKIGFSYFEPVDKIDDVDRYDIKLNYCITPKTFYPF
jgi:5-formyltetrahydrofolate cyclo-ligase